LSGSEGDSVAMSCVKQDEDQDQSLRVMNFLEIN
jgi:hypothetical protein